MFSFIVSLTLTLNFLVVVGQGLFWNYSIVRVLLLFIKEKLKLREHKILFWLRTYLVFLQMVLVWEWGQAGGAFPTSYGPPPVC